jgi:geranylgeranyl reductase family protein
MEGFDVAVVGGGPAGCRIAWRLARAGARVAIVDGSHPREKPCGGGVTARALELVRDAIDCESLEAATIHGASFENGSRTVRIPLKERPSASTELLVASRERFDAALLAAARGAGAAHVPARVTDLGREGAGWQIATRASRFNARWVIGADGVTSLVRRRVSRSFARADLSIATGFFVRGVSSPDIAIAFEQRPPGYLWSFPRRDHLAVGICAQADGTSTAALVPVASRWVARNVADRLRLDPYSWPIPSLRESTARSEHPAGPGWMLVGDAAGMVDPITREGIFFALLSAEHAADSLIASSADPSARYIERVRDTIYAELVRAAQLKARFFDPRFITLLIRALAHSARIRAIMVDLIAGRQAYHGLRRRLLATFEVGLLIELFRA